MKLFWNEFDGFLTIRLLLRFRIRFHFATAALSFLAGVLCTGPLLILGAIVVGNLATPAQAATVPAALVSTRPVAISLAAPAARNTCVIAVHQASKTWRYAVAIKPAQGELRRRWIPFGYAQVPGDCRPPTTNQAAQS